MNAGDLRVCANKLWIFGKIPRPRTDVDSEIGSYVICNTQPQQEFARILFNVMGNSN